MAEFMSHTPNFGSACSPDFMARSQAAPKFSALRGLLGACGLMRVTHG